MSKVDDELTRQLRGAQRPVDVEELFVGLERRRDHRRRVRRVQTGLLALAVLTATGAGFLALRATFERAPLRPAVDPKVLPHNGRIVFSRLGSDGHYHLFVTRPDGTDVQQLTHGKRDDTDPAISPDGRWVTVVRIERDGSEQVETIPFGRPDAPPREPQFSSISPEPSWSADGSMIAVREGSSQEPSGTALLLVPLDGDSRVAHVAGPGADLAHPSWSPDSRIVFALLDPHDAGETDWDLATVSSAGGGFRWLLREAGDQTAPAWSPDGSRIAFLQRGDRGDEIWTIAPDGTDKTLIATAVASSLRQDLAWTPDGTAVLVSDGEWIYHVDASPERNPTENLLPFVRGLSPSSQPIVAGTDDSIPEPSASVSPEAARDIGLELPMCDLEVLQHIDWDGTGVDGTAWTGAAVDEDGSCRSAERRPHIVAVDRDGDGVAERGSTWTLGSCLLCRPFDTVDLSGDGVRELVVLEVASSTPVYTIFEVSVSERAPGVYPVLVAAPGAPAMDLRPGEQLRLTVGGDEAFSGGVRCTGEEPVIEYTWVNGGVDVTTDLDVDVARFVITTDGAEIRSVDEYSIPLDAPDPIARGPQCGVNWYPAP